MTAEALPAPELAAETDDAGRFVRQRSRFRDWVRADGSTPFPAVGGRYHLYVSLACPWAHRTVIVRRLKGLEDVVGMSVVDPVRDERGWAFREGPGHGADPVNGFAFLAEAYAASDPAFTGRVTVPVLWDRELGRIVNNESADIIRMLNAELPGGETRLDLFPAPLRREIEEVNALVYAAVNDGVYRAGFASSQAAYEEAFDALFAALDLLDARLARSRWLVGNTFTEADVRLFTTLLRFDPVYEVHFKCNLRRLADFPALSGFVRDVYQAPGVAGTVDMDHIKRHYYLTHGRLNPMRIVPKGPAMDLDAAHGREALGPPALPG